MRESFDNGQRFIHSRPLSISLWETAGSCLERSRRISPRSLIFKGPSMKRTLLPGDVVGIIPYGQGQRLRCGDVAVFLHPLHGEYVAHRVIMVSSAGVRTRGDNNLQNDPWILSESEVLGRVAGVYRGARQVPILGGGAGRCVGAYMHARARLMRLGSRFGRACYRRASRLNPWRSILTKRICFRREVFHRFNGDEVILRWGRIVVARRLLGEERWRLRPPFKLFFDADCIT